MGKDDFLNGNISNISHEFLVVGIGASAGGIHALKGFFQQVPPDSGMAYVVILHLSPNHDSQLAEVLQMVCSVPVKQVTENTKIEADHVYVVPPNQHLIIEAGFIAPSPNTNPEDRRAPVDIFFRNLADNYGPRAVCVVLSGTGANGSMGLKRIKEMGGVAFVQSPREAEFNEMPRNSLATDLVDEVLPVAEIPAKLIAYRNSLGTVQIIEEPVKRPEVQQQALRDIFSQLRVRTGHDFSNYKRPTLLRRIERRINIRNLPDLPSYASYLHHHPDEANALLKDLLISVTNFFRDPKPFFTVEQEILPAILRNKKSGDTIRIWVAGCATGEEAYSLAMLCAEQTLDTIDAPGIQLFATDIDEAAISTARDGFYTINDAADVSPERLRRFFHHDGSGYRIRREIREMVLFAHHNFLKDPPFSRLDLVTCRNVLIYLNASAQERVMETFHFALKPEAFLFLGTSESVDGAGDLYTTFNREHHIFQARIVSARHYPVPEHVPTTVNLAIGPPAKREETESKNGSRTSFGDLHQQLLEQYAPPSVVVNKDYEVVHLSESAGKYFEFHGGEPTQNLLNLVRAELRLELRSALYQAVQQRKNVEARHLKVIINGHAEFITIHVRPTLKDGDSSSGFLLVLFEQEDAGEPVDESIVVSADDPVSRQLEQELIAVKSQLRSSIEHHEFQSEELKATNEELQAMNEELRSSTEELETSKEELQSINEELRTVNQELKVKIEETGIAGNNLQNLINSADVATIFLDRAFRIRMFTPAVFEIFNLIASDHGRLITDITNKLESGDLLQDAQTVLDKLTVIDREVSTTDNRSFLMRLLPYRTAEDSINGVVITFYEISSRKAAEQALQRSEEHLRLLIESANDYAIFTLDMERHILSWSIGAQTITGYSEAEIRGQLADIIFTPEDRQVHASEMEVEKAEKDGRAENERWHLRKDGTRFWGSGSVSPLRDRQGKLLGFVKILRDLTEVRRLEESKFFLASIVESTNDSVITIDFERKITSWNKAAEELYGYSSAEAVGKDLTMLTFPVDLVEILKNVGSIEHSRQVTVFDTIRLHKDGHDLDLEIVLSPVLNSRQQVIGVSTIARNVSDRKRREAHLAFLADLSQELIGLKVVTDIGHAVLSKVGMFFGASVCALTEKGEQGPSLLAAWNSKDRSPITDQNDLPEYIADDLLTSLFTGQALVVQNSTQDVRLQKATKGQPHEIISFLNIPLMRSGRWYCSIGVYLDHPRAWRDDEVTLLRETEIRLWHSIERARAEEALRLSEDRFRTLTDAIPQVIWANDGNGRANYFNERWYAYSGLDFDQSYGLGWEAIVHPDDAPASKERWHSALAKGVVFDTEYRLRDANGDYSWHIGRNIPLKDNSGHVVGWFGSATEIEGLKRTEVLLRQTADRFQLALDAGELGSYEYDFRTKETTCTARHKKNFGYSENEPCRFEELTELSVAEDRAYVESALQTAIAQQTVYAIEYRILLRTGEMRWIKSVGRIIPDLENRPEKMVGITLDITDEKLFTQELQKQVEERTIELQRSNDDLRQFAHVASHDLKEPVRKIKTFNSRLIAEFSDLLPDKAKTYLHKITTATNRMYAMVDGVLAYSKLSNSVQAFTSVDLNDVLQQIEIDLEVLIQAKNAVINRSELPIITASEVLIYQLFYNLIMNSLKFSKEGQPAEINITLSKVDNEPKDMLRVTLTDNGIGFEPGFEEEIFDPFTRLHAADQYEGTGLGLALCKKIVERHHGTISASSVPGEGATFTILFPMKNNLSNRTYDEKIPFS